mmetsp:Transcript_7359/g.6954  ORF Transcript_7359/g.6954 Transcript_7359/m.6954 type:complete len:139 (-) Transcript_7359:373-789(-)
MDYFELNNMSFADRSRSALEDGMPSRFHPNASPMNMPMAFSRPFQTYGGHVYSANSLMANDYEAITALNSMSNSSVNPSSTKPSRPKFSTKQNHANKNPKTERKSSPKTGKTSLFAKVVGGVKAKDAKKKKQVKRKPA